MIFDTRKKIFSFKLVFLLFASLITFRKNFTARHEKMIVCMTLACSILDLY